MFADFLRIETVADAGLQQVGNTIIPFERNNCILVEHAVCHLGGLAVFLYIAQQFFIGDLDNNNYETPTSI
jgi:hypothetical protein